MQMARRNDSGSDEGEDDRRTVGTGFSMSSSAMFRNEKLTTLDDQFDKVGCVLSVTSDICLSLPLDSRRVRR